MSDMTTINVAAEFVAPKADEIMREIDDTIADESWRNSKGQRMPPWVGSFSELHDYVDANCYGRFCDDIVTYVRADGSEIDGFDDEANDFVNAAQDEVDKRLRERAPQGHKLCPPGRHTFDPGDLHYEGRVDEYGRTLCNDCGALMFYCTSDEDYHHAASATPDCFLIHDGVPTDIEPPASCLDAVPERCALHDEPVIGALCSTMPSVSDPDGCHCAECPVHNPAHVLYPDARLCACPDCPVHAEPPAPCEGCGAPVPFAGTHLCHACAGAGVPVRVDPPAGMTYPIKLGELDSTQISALAATLAGALDDSQPDDDDTRAQVAAARDAAALDEIQHMLRDPEYGVGMLEDIAEIVRRAGRDTSTQHDEAGEPVSTWARH